MKTVAIALATLVALSGAAFAKDSSDSARQTVKVQSAETVAPTYESKRFIDPTATGSISTQEKPSKRLGADIDPSVLPTFH